MGDGNYTNEPDSREIDMMLKYVPAYSEDNARNIKDKFEQKAKIKHKKFSLKRLTLIATAASMILFTTLVYADILDLGKIYRIIFGENVEYVEQYIEPLVSTNVNNTVPIQNNATKDEDEILVESEAPLSTQSEYDGIIVKLISAINDENVLRIFATVTDTKGDRLGESLEFTSWGLNQGYGGNISVVDYDNKTKTATLMITSLGADHQGNATLVINGFSTGRELLENLSESNINISELLKGHTPEVISQDDVWTRGGVGNNRKLFLESRLLKSDEFEVQLDNVDMFSISNIGFVDGLFHIQAKAATSGADGYYINMKLVNSKNEIVYEPVARVDFIADQRYPHENYDEYINKPHYEYSEMIYDGVTSPEQLNDLSLKIDYMKSPKITEVNWEFSFVVPKKVITEFQVDREFNINSEKLRVDMISLSPLGVTIHLFQSISNDYNHNDEVFVEYGNGSIIELGQSSIHTYENESTLIFGGQIIEVENVQGIIINGEKINISQ